MPPAPKKDAQAPPDSVWIALLMVLSTRPSDDDLSTWPTHPSVTELLLKQSNQPQLIQRLTRKLKVAGTSTFELPAGNGGQSQIFVGAAVCAVKCLPLVIPPKPKATLQTTSVVAAGAAASDSRPAPIEIPPANLAPLRVGTMFLRSMFERQQEIRLYSKLIEGQIEKQVQNVLQHLKQTSAYVVFAVPGQTTNQYDPNLPPKLQHFTNTATKLWLLPFARHDPETNVLSGLAVPHVRQFTVSPPGIGSTSELANLTPKQQKLLKNGRAVASYNIRAICMFPARQCACVCVRMWVSHDAMRDFHHAVFIRTPVANSRGIHTHEYASVRVMRVRVAPTTSH